MEIVNLTAHEVAVMTEDGVTLFPSKGEARVAVVKKARGTVNGIPVMVISYGAVEGLPLPEKNTLYIVSMLVAQRLPERTDLICPDTSPDSVIRDEKNRIIGVRNFASYAN